jgi:hypothetical protein
VTFIAVLAGASNNSTSSISDVDPGLLGFLVVAALGVVLVFLLRSMTKHLRKIGPRPEDPSDPAADGSQSDASDPSAEPIAPSGAAKRR